MWSHITALFRQHPDAESVEPYRFHWNGVSLSSVTALSTVLLNERGSLVLGFVGSLPFFNRCLNLLTMLNQLTVKIMGLVCLPCSDTFLSAESLWQKWLEFVNTFELPWNIICGGTCYFPKYDLMMMIRVMITAVIVQVTMSFLLFLPLHHFFTASYFFAYLQPIILHIFSYLFCVLLSTGILGGALMGLYILKCTATQLMTAFYIAWAKSTPVFLRCNANEIKLHQQTCATIEKAEPLSV